MHIKWSRLCATVAGRMVTTTCWSPSNGGSDDAIRHRTQKNSPTAWNQCPHYAGFLPFLKNLAWMRPSVQTVSDGVIIISPLRTCIFLFILSYSYNFFRLLFILLTNVYFNLSSYTVFILLSDVLFNWPFIFLFILSSDEYIYLPFHVINLFYRQMYIFI